MRALLGGALKKHSVKGREEFTPMETFRHQRPAHHRLRPASQLVRPAICKGLLLGAVFAPVALSGVGAFAQNNYGSVVGAAFDNSGAVVPNVTVTLTSKDTGTTLTSVTNGAGAYTFPNLVPGRYQLRFTSSGFQTYVQDGVDVQIGGTARVDAKLAVGSQGEVISVSAAPPALQTESATLGGVVEAAQVLQTPLSGRNVNNLLALVPGVVAGGGTSGSPIANQAGGLLTNPIAYGNYQIGGGFSGQSAFFVDGVQSNVPENNVNTLIPTQDAVQEFRVSTSAVSAEYGNFAGGVVNIATKSGTNSFHGTAYEYFRNTVLDANDWFSNHNRIPRIPLHQNQFGGNLGGPIVRDKTFFFFGYEKEIFRSQRTIIDTIPTTAELNGDFSQLSKGIYDRQTPGSPQFSCNGVPNVICANRIDPTAQRILKAIYPTPTNSALTTNYIVTAPVSGNQDQYNARIDQHFGSKNTLFARYTFWNPSSGPSDAFRNGTGIRGTTSDVQEGALGDTHVIDAHTVADVRLSYLRYHQTQQSMTYGYNIAPFGPAYAALQTQFGGGVLPAVTLPGFTSVGNLFLDWLDNVYSITGSIDKQIGRHELKFGGNVRQVTWITRPPANSAVSFGSIPDFTANQGIAGSGNSIASFLLGVPSTTSNSQASTTHSFFHNFGLFINDTFQVSPKMTIVAGLRYEQPGALSEKNDLNAVILPTAPNSLGTIFNPALNAQQQLLGSLALVNGSVYHSRRPENLHWLLFDPRFGFTYRPLPTLVFRGGFGISHLATTLSQNGPVTSPINASTTSLSNVVGSTPSTTVANPFPSGIILPTGRNEAALSNFLGQTITGEVPQQPYTYVQQFNLAIEKAIGNNLTVSVAYSGSTGRHLLLAGEYTWSSRNLNQLPDQYLSLGSALLNPVANPFFGQIKSGPLSGPTVLRGYLLKPFPQYQYVSQENPAQGTSSYNGLQSSVNYRFKSGGYISLAHTWSKLLSNTDSVASFLDSNGGGFGVVQDNNNLAAEYALSLQDFPQNLQISYGLNLPFGQGARYLHDSGPIVSRLVSGWRVNGITSIRSGGPLAFLTSPNALSTFFGAGTQYANGLGVIRPNVVAGCNRGSAHTQMNGGVRWFNTACFTAPGQFSFGNESRTDSQLRSDGIKNFDLSATKATTIHENVRVEFSGELFNLFNRKQFSSPDGNLADGTFGLVTSQLNTPRLAQLALRVAF